MPVLMALRTDMLMERALWMRRALSSASEQMGVRAARAARIFSMRDFARRFRYRHSEDTSIHLPAADTIKAGGDQARRILVAHGQNALRADYI